MNWQASILAAALLGWMTPLQADQNDPSLNGLFDQLKTAPDAPTAIKIEDRIWNAWYRIGDDAVARLVRQGAEAASSHDYAAALKDFSEVTRRAPQYAEGWNLRATIYYDLGDYESSLDDVARVLKLEPRHFGALFGQGLCYLSLQDRGDALKSFQKALAIHPWMTSARDFIRSLQPPAHAAP